MLKQTLLLGLQGCCFCPLNFTKMLQASPRTARSAHRNRHHGSSAPQHSNPREPEVNIVNHGKPDGCQPTSQWKDVKSGFESQLQTKQANRHPSWKSLKVININFKTNPKKKHRSRGPRTNACQAATWQAAKNRSWEKRTASPSILLTQTTILVSHGIWWFVEPCFFVFAVTFVNMFISLQLKMLKVGQSNMYTCSQYSKICKQVSKTSTMLAIQLARKILRIWLIFSIYQWWSSKWHCKSSLNQ